MPVMDTLIVRGRSVLRMFGSAETSGAGVPDGTVRLYNDGTSSYLQVYSLATGAWDTLNPKAANDLLYAAITHASTHSDGGADEVSVEDLATSGAAGTVPTSNGSGGLSMEEIDAGDTLLFKAADETVNNSDTLQDDATFTFSVEANGVYMVQASLGLLSTATADWQFTWTLPSGGTWDLFYEGTVATFSTNTLFGRASGSGGAITVPFGTDHLWRAHFVLRNSSSAGTATFQWAQGTQTGTDTTVYAGSVMRYRKVN